ncbi:hypothetical protein KDD30_21350 (plasmid) [Photobacterium sp. GJ3]|uniref:hypothetical protein n=1 Tax=Photobacterium sp. GJ3 TaxID=2829502 RepID=UPI001B8BF548|nr:hypothetical protein [Photobacterium sp. GJ3]QUJ69320.1 hypothetical protein KDD30_21350 [Photobacterium sp. GJ3]
MAQELLSNHSDHKIPPVSQQNQTSEPWTELSIKTHDLRMKRPQILDERPVTLKFRQADEQNWTASQTIHRPAMGIFSILFVSTAGFF